MRWDSPFVLAVAGTLAIHTILIVATDATEQYTRESEPEIAPHIELVDLEMPAPPPPPPPPPVEKPPEPPPPEPKEVKAPPVPQQKVSRVVQPRQEQPKTAEPPPTDTPPDPNPTPGGEQVVQMPDAPAGRGGVPVAHGKPHDRIGRGGTGGGTGGGSGEGSGDIKPASIATIKTRAMPKGDYSFFSAGKDYPPEARQLGIQGQLRVRLVVDEHGKVTAARLLNSLGHGLDELAMTRAKSIEFDPAKDSDDKPVSSVVVWTFDMRLPE